MKLYSVNEALGLLNSLNGQRIYLEGLFCFETENISLSHWPKSEDKGQSIWVQEGTGVFRFNPEALEKLSGKKVVCLG